MSKTSRARITISRERTVHTYAELWHGANVLRGKADADPHGSTWVYMAALVMYAFSVEAYCNFAGPHAFDPESWKEHDRLAPLDKLKLIAIQAGASFDKSRRPISTMRQLFKLRNSLAHGRQVTLQDRRTVHFDPTVSDYLANGYMPAPWEKYCQQSFVEQVYKDIDTVLRDIHEKLPDGIIHLFVTAIGSASATLT